MNYYQQQPYKPMYQSPQLPYLKGHFVSSIDEARATSVDFDGTVSYFPDTANKRIYTKQINMDGTSSFMMYELKEIPIEEPKEYITKAEFEQAITELRNSFGTMQVAETSQKNEKKDFNF